MVQEFQLEGGGWQKQFHFTQYCLRVIINFRGSTVQESVFFVNSEESAFVYVESALQYPGSEIPS